MTLFCLLQHGFEMIYDLSITAEWTMWSLLLIRCLQSSHFFVQAAILMSEVIHLFLELPLPQREEFFLFGQLQLILLGQWFHSEQLFVISQLHLVLAIKLCLGPSHRFPVAKASFCRLDWFFLDWFISFKPEVLVDCLARLSLFDSHVVEAEADVIKMLYICCEGRGFGTGGHGNDYIILLILSSKKYAIIWKWRDALRSSERGLPGPQFHPLAMLWWKK